MVLPSQITCAMCRAMTVPVLLLLAIGVFAVTADAAGAVPQKLDEAGVKQLFDQWNAALQTGNPEKVVDLYADNSVLLPTMSNQPRTDRASKVAYFEEFLQKAPVGVPIASYIRFPSDNTAVNSGVYVFAVTDPKNGRQFTVPARYTYVYQYDPKDSEQPWKIIEHHSSELPEPYTGYTLEDIAALFDTWNAALQTGDAETVAALYADNSVLLPTLSNTPRTDHAGKVAYFRDEFLPKHPKGTINEQYVRWASKDQDAAINSGVYTFDVKNKDGTTSQVGARYTFVYRLIDGIWQITEHHSSLLPETKAQGSSGRRLLL